MNYIELLTQEEKVNLCGIMGGRDFKELFKHNERDFQKIRKGFRAKSLTEELALSIAIANVDKPFIASWVNTRVQIWLDEIHENITKLEGEGSAHDIALATTIGVIAQSICLVDKQHTAHGPGNDRTGFLCCSAKIFTHEAAAINFYDFLGR